MIDGVDIVSGFAGANEANRDKLESGTDGSGLQLQMKQIETNVKVRRIWPVCSCKWTK